MNSYVDLIIDHIGQLCTIPAHDSGPQRGHRLGDLGLMENVAVAIQNEQIVAAGPREHVLASYSAAEIIDAQDKVDARPHRSAYAHYLCGRSRTGVCTPALRRDRSHDYISARRGLS